MANMTLFVIALIATVMMMNCVETRSIHKLNNLVIPEGWKEDKEYNFEWKGAFHFGVPPNTCKRVYQPEHGRFICSKGTLVDRNMCLVECKIGYEQVQPPVVYICQDGVWKNLKHQKIATPEPNCVPKSDNLKQQFPQ